MVGPSTQYLNSPAVAEALARLQAAGVPLEALQPLLSAEPAPASAGVPELELTELNLAAAVHGSFLPSDISAGQHDRRALDTLLAHCEMSLTGGRKGWQLRPEARRRILEAARATNRLSAAVASTAPDGDDAEGPWLRRILAGEQVDVRQLSREDLTRLATVQQWLDGTEFVIGLPSQEELRRGIARGELLEPFHMLTGRPLSPQGYPGGQEADRVVGRIAEMEQLRSYVGVLKPEELHFHAKRILDSLWSTISRRGDNQPLVIRGVGGMGKSTLIAKFILDHALFAALPMPFVYLDFDRAALAPRQPLQLLIEIAVQLGLHAPELERDLKPMRADLRDAIDSQGRNEQRTGREGATSTELASFCEHLRLRVEAFNGGRAPVLMVLDTYEVVQYDEAAVRGVSALIETLRQPSKTAWDNLRIVVAGRGDLDEIVTKLAPVRLRHLGLKPTAELIARRSAADGLQLTPRQIRLLAPALTNSPLDVILVTRWLRDRQPGERPALIESLVEGLEERPDEEFDKEHSDNQLAALRITGILTQRMIGHINDRDVRALAMPGLVVRAVTPEVVREVMAPASGMTLPSPQPATDAPEVELTRRLERERWLVSRQGNVLRHRTEVRRAMLDLMRRHDPAGFERANQLAIHHFESRAHADLEARGELVYHLLLANAPLDQTEAWWMPSLASALAPAVEDLCEPAQSYLRARLGRSVPEASLTALPGAVLEQVLRDSGDNYLRALGPDTVVRLIERLDSRRQVTITPLQLEACYRSGRWLREHWLAVDRHLRDSQSPLPIHRLRAIQMTWWRWATRDPDAALPSDKTADLQRKLAPRPMSALIGRATFLAACSARGTVPPAESHAAISLVEDACRGEAPRDWGPDGMDSLRVLAFFERAEDRPILRRVDFENYFATISGPEIRAFRKLVTRHSHGVDPDTMEEVKLLLSRLEDLPENAVIADHELTRPFATIVSSFITSGVDKPRRAAVLSLLSMKHPDWLQPLGSSLNRAFRGEVPRRIGLLTSIEKYFGNTGRPRRRKASVDGVQVLAMADEASCLPAAIAEYVRLARAEDLEAEDFLHVASAFARWQRMLASRIDA